jgi:hypothetical protein
LSETRRPRWSRFLTGLKNAFAFSGPHGELTAEDHRLLDRLAGAIVRRRMTMPAMLFLRSVGPLSGIGSQAMVFLRPFLTPLLNPAEYDRMTAILERREGLAALVEAVDAAQAHADTEAK